MIVSSNKLVILGVQQSLQRQLVRREDLEAGYVPVSALRNRSFHMDFGIARVLSPQALYDRQLSDGDDDFTLRLH